jgi:dienelactone hydrolase
MLKTHWLAVLALLTLDGGCQPARARPLESDGGVRLIVSPDTVLSDQQPSIVAAGLRPHQVATLLGVVKLDSAHTLVSRAVFRADANGVLDLTRDAPDSGTYAGIDAAGPLWSLMPDDRGLQTETNVWSALPRFAPPTPTAVGFELIAGDRRSYARLTQLFVAPSTRRVSIRDAGLVGTLFIGLGDRPHPVVVVLGGSEGGLESSESRAALFAAHGYAALALAYFRTDGLPRELVRIPLEYFEHALAWIATQPELDARRIAVVGASRGAEAALLLAARSPVVRATVAYAPSSMVWGGLDRTHPSLHIPAWTSEGVDLESGTSPRILDVPDSVSRYGIPVERMHGPVLLIAGADDRLWPSAKMANQVMERLRAHGRA